MLTSCQELFRAQMVGALQTSTDSPSQLPEV